MFLACSLFMHLILFQHRRYGLRAAMIRLELKPEQGRHGRRPLLLVELRMRAHLTGRGRIGTDNSHPDLSGLSDLLTMMTPVVLHLVSPAMITGDDQRGLVLI